MWPLEAPTAKEVKKYHTPLQEHSCLKTIVTLTKWFLLFFFDETPRARTEEMLRIPIPTQVMGCDIRSRYLAVVPFNSACRHRRLELCNVGSVGWEWELSDVLAW